MNKPAFFNLAKHKQIFAIALPMMLSNISVPLLGLVDTAVIGHLPDAHYLAGVAVGAMIISLLFWVLNFLRMSTTGLVAQAYGAKEHLQIIRLLMQAVFIALLLSLLLVALQIPISWLAFNFVEGSEKVLFYAEQYFSIRIWSAPAALINMALLGWLLGMQNARVPMLLLIVGNTVNILLDIVFVIYFQWDVAGVAWASLCADYLTLCIASFFIFKMVKPLYQVGNLALLSKELTHFSTLKKFILLNRDIFIRSLCLQVTFAFMTIQGTKLGDDIVSANSVLMHFLLLISFSMDGLAYAVEALVGKSIGQRCITKFKDSVYLTLFWAALFSVVQLLIFYCFGEWIITQITTIEAVQQQAFTYLPWLIIIPLTTMLGFIFDGIFIGMTRAAEMRNSMLFSIAFVYFPVWWLFSDLDNHALWVALNCFMLARGLTLIWIYRGLDKSKQLLS